MDDSYHGKWNSNPTSNPGIQTHQTLAASALRSSALPITFAILVITFIAYFIFFESFKQQRMESLALYSKERVGHELEVFRMADDNLSILVSDAREHYQAISLEEAARLFGKATEKSADGTTRNR